MHLLRGGAGEPVLFLHAAGGAGAWLPFHAQLAGAGFEVIAPDHPGFGQSDDFPEVEAIDDLVYHYLDVLDGLGLDRPHVVGASFGGWIAAEVAVHSPHLIGSLTLLSAAGLRLPDHPVADVFLMSPAKLASALFHDPLLVPPPAPPPPGAAPDLDAIIASYREATSLARFSWAPYLSDPKLERRLGRITAPTLVVAPSDDRLVPVAHARRYAALIGGADYAEVAECGHAMHVERPAEFAALVASFLASHPLAPLAESGVSR
ncbi:MAG TPA: alpha/beta fold hydrolase [Nocardioides sp.]|uniref:alpha/beta fold hydrolase n=1 Tax=Nocardioides sp. TaxID=35761 RepID=UPI002B90DB00|nr:alpha/beta fold hydrolase [Nocardioides sp.]HTW14803.1 alpha/beta fold hydrolase [Nocardioides sp.]